MKIITKAVLSLETMQWIPELEESYLYSGPLDLCLGGATSGEKGIAVDEETFLQNMQDEQQTQFQNEQTAQNQVQQAWAPIVAGGAYQYGFSTAEDQQLQGNIENAGAQATENTENAAQLRQQQATGGAGGGPAGGQAALDAQIAATGAQSTATNLGQEKEQGYSAGRQLFEQGTGAEEAVAGLSSPTSYANSANTAASTAMSGQEALDAANANSLLSKVVGGVVGAIPGIGGSVAEGMSGGGGASDVLSSVAGFLA
jgi:hypothetical protein